MNKDELKAKYGRIANDPSQLEMFKNDLIEGKVIEDEAYKVVDISDNTNPTLSDFLTAIGFDITNRSPTNQLELFNIRLLWRNPSYGEQPINFQYISVGFRYSGAIFRIYAYTDVSANSGNTVQYSYNDECSFDSIKDTTLKTYLDGIKTGYLFKKVLSDIPSLPSGSSEKTLTLKAVNGVIQWVEE